MYERAGVAEPWPNQADLGRFAVTNDEGDRMKFKVPTLRNVAETAPYFHDGSAATLEVAVRMMGRHQLGLELSDAETGSIVVWLKSLTGKPVPGADLDTTKL
jgi:cytochrome c peroxidase